MGIIRTYDRSLNSREVGFRLRESGVLKSPPSAVPLYVGSANVVNGFGPNAYLSVYGSSNNTVDWDSFTVEGDLGILVVESSGDDATLAPAGWTHVTGSPVVDVASAAGSKLSVFWKFAESSFAFEDTSPVSAEDATTEIVDHFVARMYVYRNVRRDVPPGRISATDTKTTPSTVCTFPSIDTPVDNCRVIMIGTDPTDSFTGSFSGQSNANLTFLVERDERRTTSANGGGYVILNGNKATAGATGTTTCNTANSSTNAVITFALEPAGSVLP